jgi:hypothetical protein
MRGEFAGIKDEIIRGIFEPLIDAMSDDDFQDEDLWGDLFREAIPAPIAPTPPFFTEFDEDGNIYLQADLEARAAYDAASAAYQERLEAYSDASNRSDLAWQYLVDFFQHDDTTEPQIVTAIEDAFEAIEDYGGGELANSYFVTVRDFLEKFSLRYDLRRPANGREMTLHPTLPGMFARLIRDLKQITSQQAALNGLMQDFEESLRDLKAEQSPRKIRQCRAAQFNLLEALLKQHPDVVAFNATARREANTFGAMCDRTVVWPHEQIKESAKGIYRFANDYPGIRHAGTAASQLREIEMRDLVSVTIMLAGFTPYFTDALDAGHAHSD